MIVNWQRMFRWTRHPIGFVACATSFAALFGLAPALIVHWLIQPLSRAQILLSAVIFAAFGFVRSVSELLPPSLRARVGATFSSHHSIGWMEALVWLGVFATGLGIYMLILKLVY
jgi:uncharacterized membrane protein YozB (DUF420 family)